MQPSQCEKEELKRVICSGTVLHSPEALASMQARQARQPALCGIALQSPGNEQLCMDDDGNIRLLAQNRHACASDADLEDCTSAVPSPRLPKGQVIFSSASVCCMFLKLLPRWRQSLMSVLLRLYLWH